MTAPVVVVGDTMVDVVATAAEPIAHGSDASARIRWSGGGGGANVAAWLAHMGAAVTLVTRVGDDHAGRAACAELRDAGVDVRAAVDPCHPTGTCVVVVTPDGERTMLPDRGANAALAPEDLPVDCFAPGGHLHLSGYVLLDPASRPAGLRAVQLARAAGMRVSIDPASSAPLRASGGSSALEWLDGADLLLANRDEAEALTGSGAPERAAAILAQRVGEVVVKLGAEGALWTDGTAVVTSPAPPVRAVDTTGAGDAFAAGWIAARRAGSAVADALAAGCRLGARVAARGGARP